VKIGLVTIAYTPGGHTEKQLDSILPHSQHDIITYLYLHNSRSEELINECETLTQKYNLGYYPYGVNRGFSKSINEGIHNCYDIDNCDIVLFMSQDVWFNTDIAFNNWVNDALPFIDKKFIVTIKPSPTDKTPFGAWIHTRLGWDKLGCLDENFFPAQYEDIDIHIRSSYINSGTLENYFDPQYRQDVLADASHPTMLVRTDQTLAIQQHFITAPLCKLYFERKWLNDYNPHKTPFNDPNTDCYIPWVQHDCPYGIDYDRQDQGIVRI
jgi:hypothetical protein